MAPKRSTALLDYVNTLTYMYRLDIVIPSDYYFVEDALTKADIDFYTTATLFSCFVFVFIRETTNQPGAQNTRTA